MRNEATFHETSGEANDSVSYQNAWVESDNQTTETAAEHTNDNGCNEVDALILSVITHDESKTIPTSKAFWQQGTIATQGSGGADITVGKDVTITTSISDGNENPIKLTVEQLAIQLALGDLILRNGKPLKLSIVQIVRAALNLSAEEYPSSEQIETYEKALDDMLFAKSQISFKSQLNAHKKIKRVPNEDYNDLQGTLVAGMKYSGRTVTSKGIEVKCPTYLIYDMPMYYKYSRLFNQITTVKNNTLTSGSAAAKLPEGHPDKKKVTRSASNEVARQYILSLLNKPDSISVSFGTLASRCCIDISTRRKERTLRNNIMSILRDLKAAKVITNFCEYKKGSKVEGVKINQ